MIETEKIEKIYDTAIELLITHGVNIVAAIVTLIIGLWIINRFVKVMKKVLVKREMDESLQPFLISLINIGLKVMLLISIASMVGIQTTSFIAVLGAAGLAIGLALQGSLANFAGGVLILLFKPYKVGDFIEAQGESGTVKEIHIFVSKIVTLDNKLVIVPNGSISNGNITNYSAMGIRRVDLTFGIHYKDDIKKAKEILLNTIKSNELIMKDPEPFVGVGNLGDSSVDIVLRPWCKVEDYWDVFFQCNEACKYALEENDITIPFPQTDVHLYGEK